MCSVFNCQNLIGIFYVDFVYCYVFILRFKFVLCDKCLIFFLSRVKRSKTGRYIIVQVYARCKKLEVISSFM